MSHTETNVIPFCAAQYFAGAKVTTAGRRVLQVIERAKQYSYHGKAVRHLTYGWTAPVIDFTNDGDFVVEMHGRDGLPFQITAKPEMFRLEKDGAAQ